MLVLWETVLHSKWEGGQIMSPTHALSHNFLGRLSGIKIYNPIIGIQLNRHSFASDAKGEV